MWKNTVDHKEKIHPIVDLAQIDYSFFILILFLLIFGFIIVVISVFTNEKEYVRARTCEICGTLKNVCYRTHRNKFYCWKCWNDFDIAYSAKYYTLLYEKKIAKVIFEEIEED